MSEKENTFIDFLLSQSNNEKPIDEFIDKIVNKNLNIYQNVIQYGAKEGQSLVMHILNCVFTLAKLADILNISEEEQKVLMVALTLHDINKTPDSPQLAYKHVATLENIEKEILKLDIPSFMPDWKDYLEDLKILLHAHSDHSNFQGELLYIAEDNTKIGKIKLDDLKYLVRACDDADLSKDFSEINKRTKFLFNLNSFAKKSNKSYQLISHKVLEQRGILTNLLHKNIQEYLQEEFNAIPIFLYPEGTYYLVPSTQKVEISQDGKKAIGIKVKNNLDKLKKAKFDEYIGKDQTQGIKVDPVVIGLATIEEIFSIIDFKIQKKTYKISDKELDDRNKLAKKIEKAKPEEKVKLELLLQEEKLYGETQDLMKLGELVRTFYIFLSSHCDKELIKLNKSYKDIWNYIYELIELPKDKIELYSVSDGLYQRAYIIAKDLTLSYEYLLEKFPQIISELLEQNNDQEIQQDKQSDIVDYVISNITFDFENYLETDFSSKLLNYVQNNHKQCSCCNSSFKTKEMMSGDVPYKIKVQLFSNRLTGGSYKDPKRNLCPICKEQFSLEKLNFSGAGEKPLYIHMIAHSFIPQEFMIAFKNTFEDFVKKEISAFYLNIKETLNSLKEKGYLSLKINKSDVFGVAIPKYPSEVLGNVITITINSVKLNETERYLKAVDYALFLNKYFNFKVLVTESSIPIFGKNEFDEIFFDGLPSNLKGFIEKQNLDKNDILKFWDLYLSVRKISDTLNTSTIGESYFKLVLGLIKGKQNLFFTVDRLIEDKLRGSKSNSSVGLSQHLSREIYSSVETIIHS